MKKAKKLQLNDGQGNIIDVICCYDDEQQDSLLLVRSNKKIIEDFMTKILEHLTLKTAESAAVFCLKQCKKHSLCRIIDNWLKQHGLKPKTDSRTQKKAINRHALAPYDRLLHMLKTCKPLHGIKMRTAVEDDTLKITLNISPTERRLFSREIENDDLSAAKDALAETIIKSFGYRTRKSA